MLPKTASQNAKSGILVIFGRLTPPVRLLQPLNALPPIEVTFGRLMDVRLSADSNAEEPMEVTVSGTVISTRLVS